MQNNNETKLNLSSLLPTLKSGKITLDFDDAEILINISVNRKGNIVEQVVKNVVNNTPTNTNETTKEEVVSVSDKVISEKPVKECRHNENETGWFKGTYIYGGEVRSSYHYYEDGIAVCDNGIVSRNHMLTVNHIKVDNPETVDCCKKCESVLAKRKVENYHKLETSNATGWYIRTFGLRKTLYKHFYKNGNTICRNKWRLTVEDKATSLDTKDDCNVCKDCLERAKTINSVDVSNKKVIRTFSSKDIIKPDEILDSWNSKLIKIDNPVPLNDTDTDDIYVEAAKRSIVIYRKHIINTMRKLSIDNRMTVDNTIVKFYCNNKIVELNVFRNPTVRNSELTIRKIKVIERTSPNQKIIGNSYNMTCMVAKVILERSKMSNEKEN